jgi:lipoprotein LpqS
LRSVITIVVVASVLAFAGSGSVPTASVAHDPAHALLAVNLDHPDLAHLADGSLICSLHKAPVSAVLPQSPKITLVALGVVASGLAVAGLLGLLVVSAGRGPPATTGQDLLTRFCLSRR